jgi:hypothetical protein
MLGYISFSKIFIFKQLKKNSKLMELVWLWFLPVKPLIPVLKLFFWFLERTRPVQALVQPVELAGPVRFLKP